MGLPNLEIFLLVLVFFSGFKSSLSIETQCYVSGHCVMSIVVELMETDGPDECLGACKGNEKCKWFSHMPKGRVCELLENCITLSEVNCPQCLSGQKECQIKELKLMVASGRNADDAMNSAEVINVAKNGSVCYNLPDLPEELLGAFGSQIDGVPLICGGVGQGVYPKNGCLTLANGQWVHHSQMGVGRSVASIVQVSPGSFLVTGGAGYRWTFDTVEIYNNNNSAQWEHYVELPVKLREHCSVMVNKTTVMVIGGVELSDFSTDPVATTYFHHIGTSVWTEGPRMYRERYNLACGKLIDPVTQKITVVACGGRSGWNHRDYLNDTEMFVVDTETWNVGPDLPFPLFGASMLPDNWGGLYLVAGSSDVHAYSDKILHLQHQSSNWKILTQNIKFPRRDFVLSSLKEQLTNCS